MKKLKKKQIPFFYEGMDQKERKEIEKILEDEKQGRLPRPPRRPQDCRVLEDLCRYVFKLARLDGEYQMFKSGDAVKRWVWFGHEFTDRIVKVVEEVAPRLLDKDRLEELRLVATHVSPSGVKRLERVFSSARVTVYTDEEDEANWQWSQACYPEEHERRA